MAVIWTITRHDLALLDDDALVAVCRAMELVERRRTERALTAAAAVAEAERIVRREEAT